MKKILLKLSYVFFALMIVLSGCKKDEPDPVIPDPEEEEEFLASETPANRNAVLEDFTGVRCGYCPDGHDKAKAILDANPGRFVIIAVHAGIYADPVSGWANFTTPFGQALVDQSDVTGYPAGTISRIPSDQLGVPAQTPPSGLAMSRSYWASAAQAVMNMSSPLNIGAKATFDAATRELKVKVDIYYTGTETVQNNINVALLQDKLISKQSGGMPDPDNYEQNNVLRHLLTGQFGEAITTGTTEGSKYSKTFTYTVPADYNGTGTTGDGAVVIENCRVAIYVSRGNTHILTGTSLDIE